VTDNQKDGHAMINGRGRRRGWKAVLLGSLAPLGLGVALAGPGAEPLQPPGKPPIVVVVPADDLPGLRKLALEKQPSLAAYRASLSAANSKLNALDNLKLAGVLRRDLPIRRAQADQGILAAEARLFKAEGDTLYAVTRTYLSVVYAQTQRKLAQDVLSNKDTGLAILRDLAKKIYAGEMPLRGDVKKWHVDQLESLVNVMQGRAEEAVQGVPRATAALREAIGLDRDCPLPGFPDKLPEAKATLTLEELLAHALKRRGEIGQVEAGVEATSLEIDAQRLSGGLQAETFASGSDLHAEPVPQGIADGEYRPGAVTVEMPTQLIGHRSARIDQAASLHERAVAVAEKTRRLITLETEDAYYRWLETAKQAREYSEAAKKADAAAVEIARSFKPDDPMNRRPSLDEVMEFSVRAGQLRALANQAQFNALLALTALERITAGGFQPDFVCGK
jgi:outer membrane protein TolC